MEIITPTSYAPGRSHSLTPSQPPSLSPSYSVGPNEVFDEKPTAALFTCLLKSLDHARACDPIRRPVV